MKKKIKDLTFEEVKQICSKHNLYKKCKGCPFWEQNSCFELWHYVRMKKYINQFEKENDIEREIEVEDDEQI